MKRVLGVLIAGMVIMAMTDSARAADDAMGKFAESANRLAVDLYQQVAGNAQGNLFFSPYSIDTAMLMVTEGARGKTRAELEKVLHVDAEREVLREGFEGLNKRLNPAAGEERPFKLTIANALWVQKSFAILPEFTAALAKGFGVEGAFAQDFATDPEGSRQRINGWVEGHTNQKIKDLLASGMIKTDTRLVLTNAIYFKAAWVEPFLKEATHDQPFHLAGSKEVTVPLMHQIGHFSYGVTEEVQVIAVPYLTQGEYGSELSMVVVLPTKVDGLAAVEKSLTTETLAKWTGAMRSEMVHLFLPRFKMTSALSLNENLKALGAKEAFVPLGADFSGITKAVTPEQSLYISDVIHKAFVDVNEAGTEAAAATAVVMRAGSARPMKPAEFRADHPFLFLIRDDRSGAILFMGRVMDPTKE